MKICLFFVCLFAGAFGAGAQVYASLGTGDGREAARPEAVAASVSYWEFYSALPDYSGHAFARADERVFGREVACLLALMDEKYVCREQVAAGDPQLHARIAKPVVWQAVKGLVRHYRQQGRGGVLPPEECGRLAHAVKVALACLGEETADFEEELRKHRKNPERQLACFGRVRLKNIYE